jgi:hypothetical protein
MSVNPPGTPGWQVFSRTPPPAGALEPAVIRVVDQLLDRMESGAGAPVDFVADFAYPIPALVMSGSSASRRRTSSGTGRVDRIDEFLDVAGKPRAATAANGGRGVARLLPGLPPTGVGSRAGLISGLVEALTPAASI